MILTIVAILGALLGAAGLAVGIIAAQKNQILTRRIDRLQNKLAVSAPALSKASSGLIDQQKKIASLEETVSSLSKANSRVATIESCLPEIQSELGGLEIEGTISSPYIRNTTKTSIACEKLLYSGR